MKKTKTYTQGNTFSVSDTDMVEVVEYIEGGRVVRKTLNGVDLKVDTFAIPTVIVQKMFMTKEEIARRYGKYID